MENPTDLEDKAKRLVRSLDNQPAPPAEKPFRPVLIVIGIIIAGIASGWGISRLSANRQFGAGGLKSAEEAAQTGVKAGDIVGVQDEAVFSDSAEGVLVAGGIEGEGSHHLLRPGGPSRNVYLTSSIVDLNLFTKHRVRIWGETFSAQRAGWLMDVGKVKVLELNAELPFTE